MTQQQRGFIPHLGVEMTERGDERSTCALEIAEEHLNPHGVVHGAVAYAMADTGMGAAVYSVLEPDESCATIEIKIVYLAPAKQGTLQCETRVVQRTKSFAVLESDVKNGDRAIARALGTFAIFPERE